MNILGSSKAFSPAHPGDDNVQQHADGQQTDCSGKQRNIVGWSWWGWLLVGLGWLFVGQVDRWVG